MEIPRWLFIFLIVVFVVVGFIGIHLINKHLAKQRERKPTTPIDRRGEG